MSDDTEGRRESGRTWTDVRRHRGSEEEWCDVDRCQTTPRVAPLPDTVGEDGPEDTRRTAKTGGTPVKYPTRTGITGVKEYPQREFRVLERLW